MNYTVLLSPEARDEALAAAEYIAANAPGSAAIWYEGLHAAIRTLGDFPLRCPIAPEGAMLGQDLRHLIYKSHRIIFRVETSAGLVRILHIRHVRQQAIGEMD